MKSHTNPPQCSQGVASGIIVPLVTPCDAQICPDLPALGSLVERQIAGGVHGLFLLGTTGEGPALPMGARQAVVRAAVQAVAGRVPVLVGVTDSAFASVIELCDASAAAGACAVVVAPPPYHPTGVNELNAYLDAIAARSPLPFYLYSIPSRTGPVPIETFRHAMSLPKCVGFKDSSGQMTYLHEALLHRDAIRPDFRVLVGPEELLAESVLLGADGGVAGGANLFPELFVCLFSAAKRGDLPTVRRLHRVVMILSTTLYRAGRHASSFIKSVKAGLHAQGLCGPHMAMPYEAFSHNDRERVNGLYKAAAAMVDECLARERRSA
jgi:2-dehydro-3-deoxy-D-pentonate aldolase